MILLVILLLFVLWNMTKSSPRPKKVDQACPPHKWIYKEEQGYIVCDLCKSLPGLIDKEEGF